MLYAIYSSFLIFLIFFRLGKYHELMDMVINILLRLPHKKLPILGTNDYLVGSFWDNGQQC